MARRFLHQEGSHPTVCRDATGDGYSAEEQLTGAGQFGGLQIQVFPMKRTAFERRFPKRVVDDEAFACFSNNRFYACEPDMGLAPGGKIRQEIYEDPFAITDWQTDVSSRCFAHLCNSLTWREMTGKQPPKTPATAKEYRRAGLPWYEWYSDAAVIKGSKLLKKLASVAKKRKPSGRVRGPDDDIPQPERVIPLSKPGNQHLVRESSF